MDGDGHLRSGILEFVSEMPVLMLKQLRQIGAPVGHGSMAGLAYTDVKAETLPTLWGGTHHLGGGMVP